MKATVYVIEGIFQYTLLGSQPQKEVVTEFINPATPEDELAALPEKLEKATTAFHKIDGKPVLWDYQVKGFLKAAATVINGLKTFDTKALHSKVEHTVFVYPRTFPLEMPEGKELTFCERPLRAETAQGPRIALARSEEAPTGTKIHFEIWVLDGSQINAKILDGLLDYGWFCGIGQWRNSGHGSIIFKILNNYDKDIHPFEIPGAILG